MMEILKKFATVFMFAIGCVFMLVSLAFAGISCLFGMAGDGLYKLALEIEDEDDAEGEEVPSEEIPT